MKVTDVGLYVHFPWCLRLCPYCDFTVAVGRFDSERFADAILAELTRRHHPWRRKGGLASIYFGGGTPSLWGAGSIRRVIDSSKGLLGLVDGAEITVEANPEGLTDDVVGALVEAGVNRVSLGVQSAVRSELRVLGRNHDGDDVEQAWAALQSAGVATSIDIIYGLPGQSDAALFRSVERVLDLQPDHISAYSLTIEPGTHLAKRVDQGRFHPASDDEQAALGDQLALTLDRAGYPRYEVSSYAPIGSEAKHNSLYWVGADYLGVGPGAHSYLARPDVRGAGRRENTKKVTRYVDDALAGVFSAERSEHLGPRGALSDRLLVGARTSWGVDLGELEKAAGIGNRLTEAFETTLKRQRSAGWIVRDGHRVAPTATGLSFADALALQWLTALDHVEL